MTIDVTAVNDLPTAADKTVTATEDTALVFAVADFGFTDVETDQLQSITVAMLPSTGTLALNLFGEPLDTMEAIDFYANYNSITETTDLQDFFGDDRGFDLVQVGDKVSFSLDLSKLYKVTEVNKSSDFNVGSTITVSGDPVGDGALVTGSTIFVSMSLSNSSVTLGQSISRTDIVAGNLSFIPESNANGTDYDSFKFTVNDGTADSSVSSTMTIDVTAVNDLPTAADKTVTATEDTAFVFALADFGFSDVETAQLQSIAVTTLSSTGTLTLDGSTVAADQTISQADIAAGKLAFTPLINANGTGYDSFKFTVNDGTADSSASSTMTIDVTAVNDLPTAADKTVTATEDTAFVFALADFGFNDVDSGAQLQSIAVTTLSSTGTLTLNDSAVTLDQSISRSDIEAGNFKFIPVVNANGTGYDSFKFTVNDGTADSSASSTMTIDVTAVNDAPIAAADTKAVTEDATLSVDAANGVLVNDTDVDAGSTRTVTAVQGVTANVGTATTLASGAVVTLNTDGSYDFVPGETLGVGETANEVINYTITDDQGATSTSTLTITVTGVNDAPIATADTNAVTEDATLSVDAANGVLVNDTDVDTGSTRTVTSVQGVTANVGTAISLASGAVVTLNPDGSYDFVPGETLGVGETAKEVINYTITDDQGATSTSTLTITVTGVNDVPTATSTTVTATEDTAFGFAVADFGFADVDTSDQLESITVTTQPSKGTLTLSGSTVATNQSISRADIVAGNLKFAPAANANGADSLKFSVNDGNADSLNQATLTINVTAVNDAPAATGTTVTTDEDSAFDFGVKDFGFGDVDTSDQLESITVTTLSSTGTLTLSGSTVAIDQSISRSDILAGNLKFTPAANANGTGYDSFKFTVNDGTADSSTSSTMTIDVTAVNDLPTASDNTVTATEDTAFVFAVADFGFSDVDSAAQLQSIAVTTLSSAGTLALNGSTVTSGQSISRSDIVAGNLKFTPAANANGTGYDSFKFTVNDGTADSSASSTMTIDVTAVNDLPTGTDKTVTATEDTAFVFTVADFGFTDVESDQLQGIAVTTLSSTGTLTLNGSAVTLGQSISRADIVAGNLTFTPVANANGAGYDSFKFTVSDGVADSSPEYYAGTGNYYEYVSESVLSTEAQAAAAAKSYAGATGYLATILDVDENTFIANLISGSAWIGLSDAATEGQFRWLDGPEAGQLATYTNWASEEPNNSNSGEDYTEVLTTGFWNDHGLPGNPNHRVGYVVEYSPVFTEPSTMTIDVTAVNDLPTAADKTVTATEDTAFVFALADFGFSDVETGQLQSITVTTLSSTGTLALNGSAVTMVSRSAGPISRLATLNLHQRPMPMARATTVSNLPSTTVLLIRQRHRR